MKKNTKFAVSVALLYTLLSANFVNAAGFLSSGSNIKSLIADIIGIMASLVPLLVGAAIVVFLYGVFIFIAKASSGNAEGRAEGIKFMIFGIIGIAVMVSLWGLVAFVTNSLGTTNSGSAVPQFNTTNTTAPSTFGNNSLNLNLPPSSYNPPASLPASDPNSPDYKPPSLAPAQQLQLTPSYSNPAPAPSTETNFSDPFLHL